MAAIAALLLLPACEGVWRAKVLEGNYAEPPESLTDPVRIEQGGERGDSPGSNSVFPIYCSFSRQMKNS
eukprot:1339369-Amorphochlora_amoeboformis.AAC.1